jgi:crotonobetainyl-CoA:carnitine CoA-transferase CaiB-like acyl-CoA transferase
MLIEVPIPDRDPMLLCGNPIKLSNAPEGPVTSFPGLGEHTDAVLREVLELDDDEIAQLRASGTVGP